MYVLFAVVAPFPLLGSSQIDRLCNAVEEPTICARLLLLPLVSFTCHVHKSLNGKRDGHTRRFAATLRMGADVPHKEKARAVEEIIELLELQSFADMIVGREEIDEGLPKHARKRLTIGTELTSRPSVLFTDEPTTYVCTFTSWISLCLPVQINPVNQYWARANASEDETASVAAGVEIHEPCVLVSMYV